MRRTLTWFPTIMLAAIVWASPLAAGAIQPDRDNRILIQGRFNQQEPSFLLIFSAEPLLDARRQVVTSLSEAEVAQLKSGKDRVKIKAHGKKASRPGQLEYSFGSSADRDMPWNDGREFDWKDWEKHSPDVWSPSEMGRSIATSACRGTTREWSGRIRR